MNDLPASASALRGDFKVSSIERLETPNHVRKAIDRELRELKRMPGQRVLLIGGIHECPTDTVITRAVIGGCRRYWIEDVCVERSRQSFKDALGQRYDFKQGVFRKFKHLDPLRVADQRRIYKDAVKEASTWPGYEDHGNIPHMLSAHLLAKSGLRVHKVDPLQDMVEDDDEDNLIDERDLDMSEHISRALESSRLDQIRQRLKPDDRKQIEAWPFEVLTSMVREVVELKQNTDAGQLQAMKETMHPLKRALLECVDQETGAMTVWMGGIDHVRGLLSHLGKRGVEARALVLLEDRLEPLNPKAMHGRAHARAFIEEEKAQDPDPRVKAYVVNTDSTLGL